MPDEHLERIAQREVGRKGVVDDGVDDHWVTMTRSSSGDKMAVRDTSNGRKLSLSRWRGEYRIELVSKAFDLTVSQGDETSR
jgi:hypothetical protein